MAKCKYCAQTVEADRFGRWAVISRRGSAGRTREFLIYVCSASPAGDHQPFCIDDFLDLHDIERSLR